MSTAIERYSGYKDHKDIEIQPRTNLLGLFHRIETILAGSPVVLLTFDLAAFKLASGDIFRNIRDQFLLRPLTKPVKETALRDIFFAHVRVLLAAMIRLY